MLPLKALNWDDNNESRLFRGCGSADGFMKVWKQHFLPNINQHTGVFSCCDETGISRQAKSTSSTSVSLLPASKRARLDNGLSTDTDKVYSETEMDSKIKEHFLGKLTIYRTL